MFLEHIQDIEFKNRKGVTLCHDFNCSFDWIIAIWLEFLIFVFTDYFFRKTVCTCHTYLFTGCWTIQYKIFGETIVPSVGFNCFFNSKKCRGCMGGAPASTEVAIASPKLLHFFGIFRRIK